MNPQGRWGDTRWIGWCPRTDPTCFPEGQGMDVLAATPAGARLAPTRSGKRQYSMLRDTEPDRKVRIIALFAMVLALVGGLSLFNKAHGDTEPPTVVTEPPTFVATSCSGFEADAHKLFDKGDIAALSGTFAP